MDNEKEIIYEVLPKMSAEDKENKKRQFGESLERLNRDNYVGYGVCENVVESCDVSKMEEK